MGQIMIQAEWTRIITKIEKMEGEIGVYLKLFTEKIEYQKYNSLNDLNMKILLN